MTHRKMVNLFFFLLLILYSHAYADFGGYLSEVVLTTTNCSIANRGISMYAIYRFQIDADLTLTGWEDCTIQATWNSQPEACEADFLSYSVDSANCASFSSLVRTNSTDVQWTMTAKEPGCTGKIWLKVYDGVVLDPCLMILLDVEISDPGFTAPKNVSASDGTYEEFVDITWYPVTDANLYKVYRDDQYLGETTLTGYLDYSADAWRIYSYTVTACVDQNWCTDPSIGDYGYRDPFPEIVNASDGLYDDKITITWTSVQEADWYEIYRENKLIKSVDAYSDNRSFSDDITKLFGGVSLWVGVKIKYYVRACKWQVNDTIVKACGKFQGDEGFITDDSDPLALHNAIIQLLLLQ